MGFLGIRSARAARNGRLVHVELVAASYSTREMSATSDLGWEKEGISNEEQ
jgi:hypothetical protein